MLFIHCKQKISFIIIHLSNLCRLNMLGQYISSVSSLIHTPLVLARFIKIDPNLARLLSTVKLGSPDPTRAARLKFDWNLLSHKFQYEECSYKFEILHLTHFSIWQYQKADMHGANRNTVTPLYTEIIWKP